MQMFPSAQLGEAYRPLKGPGGGQWNQPVNFSHKNAQDLAEAESLDVNSAIHGHWTIENAKSKLHQFMQENRLTAEYKYCAIGPDHNK